MFILSLIFQGLFSVEEAVEPFEEAMHLNISTRWEIHSCFAEATYRNISKIKGIKKVSLRTNLLS